jgi:hypothetical protein
VAGRSKAWVSGSFFLWDCDFESNRVHQFISHDFVMCCQAEVTASGLSLIRGSCRQSVVSECDLEDP